MRKSYSFTEPSKRVLYAQGYCHVQVIIGSPGQGDTDWDGVSGVKYIGSRRTANLLINQAMKAALASFSNKFHESPDYIYLDDYTFFYNYGDMQRRKTPKKDVVKVGKNEKKAYTIPISLIYQEIERPRIYKKEKRTGILKLKKAYSEDELKKLPSSMKARVSKKSRKHKSSEGKKQVKRQGWK